MTRLCPTLALFLSVALLQVGCGSSGDGASSTDAGDGGLDGSSPVAPTVLETYPAHQATGVASDASIVFHFDRAMDASSTEAAYTSLDLPKAAVSFEWNGAADTLTIVPESALEYAEGGPDVAAKTYTVSIGTGATSATGEPLAAETTVSFTTLRRITVYAPTAPDLVGRVTSTGLGSEASLSFGDLASNTSVRGFAAFSLTGIPSGILLEGAYLKLDESSVLGSPDDALGAPSVDHIYFSGLDADAYGAELLGGVPNTAPVQRSKSAPYTRVSEVTALVSDDLANREARSDRAHFRLRYAINTDSDGAGDSVVCDPATATLRVVWLAP